MDSSAGRESSGNGRRAGGLSENLVVRLVVGIGLMLLLAMGLAVPAGAALPPVSVSQVKDIDPGPEDGDPFQGGNGSDSFGAVDLNGVLIFDAAVYPESGVELWRSDGTEAGTYLLKEINDQGPLFSSSPSWLVEMNGEVLFAASSGSVEGTELWKTDGTEAGTVLVKDIDPTPFVPLTSSSSPKNLLNVDGTLFFMANSDDADGAELWKSDGTTADTVMVKDIKSELLTPVYNFTAVGDRLFFTFNDGVNGKELWTSDGTSGGTVMVKDIQPGSESGLPGPTVNQKPSDYHAFNGELYFRATDDGLGFDLWKSDGTIGGTQKVKEIGMTGSAYFEELNGELFFSSDFSLYKTDGTDLGTVLVKGGSPDETTKVGGTLFFVRNAWQLWKSDGTGPGTEMVVDLDPGPVAGASPIGDLIDFNGTLYFGFDDGVTFGRELWRSDGTVAGTERVTDINPGSGDSLIVQPIVVGERLYFRGDDDGATGVELWQAFTDVTPPDTTIESGPGEEEVIGVDSASFNFSSSEAGSSFDCVLDAGPPEDCDSGSVTYTGLAEGPHSFSVSATDQAPFSNIDPTPATRTFTVDTTPPDTTINTGPSGTIATNQATFTFTGDPAVDTAKIQCRIDYRALRRLHLPEDLHRPLRRPPHSHLQSRRRSRKPGPDPGHPHLHRRHNPTRHHHRHRPLRHHRNRPGHLHLRRTPRRRHSQDPVPDRRRALRRLHSAPRPSPVLPTAPTPPASGPRTQPETRTRPRPPAASPSTQPLPTPPSTPAPPAPSRPTRPPSPSPDTPQATQPRSSAGSTPSPSPTAPAPKTFTGLTDGPHTASFRAEDAAGNQDPTPATRTFTVDTTPPDTTIDTGPSGTIATDQATFTFAGHPAGDTSKIQCRIDDEPFADCT